MTPPSFAKVDIYLTVQNQPGRGYWAALIKSRSREKALARISQLPSEQLASQGLGEVIGFLKATCYIRLYVNAPIPFSFNFGPHQVQWFGERTDEQKPYFERINCLARILLALMPLSSDNMRTVHILTTAVEGCWTSLLFTDGERLEAISGVESTKDNRLHLLTVSNGLESAPPPPLPVCIYSNSEYVHIGQNGLPGWSKHWRTKHGEPLQNADLWKIVWKHCGQRPLLWKRLSQEQTTLCYALAKMTLEQRRSATV